MTLVIPPAPFLVDERVFPSLGVLRVATALEDGGHAVTVCDLSGRTAEGLEIPEGTDIVGVTATTPQMPAVVEVVERVRTMTSAPVILGGPHVTMTCTSAARGVARAVTARDRLLGLADVLVSGDGEYAMVAAMEASRGTVVSADAPSAAGWLSVKRMQSLPLPARHLIDLDSYRYTIDGRRATSVVWQQGCPFGCAFCSGRSSPVFRAVRARRPESVIAELDLLTTRYGMTGIMVYDDELNVGPSSAQALAAVREYNRDGHIAFRGFVKAEILTREQCDVLVAAGFRWILIGFESASDRMLANMGKRADVAANTRALKLAQSCGLKVKALMAIGNPGETAETVACSRDWLLEHRPDDFDATIIAAYPGSRYYDEAVRTGPDRWTYTAPSGDVLHLDVVDETTEPSFYKGRPGEYHAGVWTETLSRTDLAVLRDDLEATVRPRLAEVAA